MKCPTPVKNKYGTEADAWISAVHAGKVRGVALIAYLCPTKRHWHLSSEVPAVVRPAKPRKVKQWRQDAERFRAKIGKRA